MNLSVQLPAERRSDTTPDQNRDQPPALFSQALISLPVAVSANEKDSEIYLVSQEAADKKLDEEKRILSQVTVAFTYCCYDNSKESRNTGHELLEYQEIG